MMIQTYIVILSQPNQSEINSSHASVANEGNSFIRRVEGALIAIFPESSCRQVCDIVWSKNSGTTRHGWCS